jgi:tRNA modification GTPase
MSEVIVAPATPWGYGALALVRFSGEGLDQVLRAVVQPFGGWPVPEGRQRRVYLRDAQGVFDDGVVVIGRAPQTYTGEDTAELTCHGNPLVVERLVASAQTAGARLASAGEFTRRAVLHGKMDLLRAEAVLQVSRARSLEGLRVGLDGLEGRLSEWVAEIRVALCDAAAELEARLDYPADELAYRSDEEVLGLLTETARRCREIAETAQVGRTLVDGARVALVGAVNAGKSSLFNALLGRRRALVHERPGTTRDVLEVTCTLGPVAVTLLDTAGERATDDPVEAAGLALAQELVADADLLVVVLRAHPNGVDPIGRTILERTEQHPRVVVYNAIDLPDVAPAPAGAIPTVAVTGKGLDALKQSIARALVGEEPGRSRLLIASARQRDLFLEVARRVEEAIGALPEAGIAVAADALTRGIEVIDALTGAETREAVLDTLFARFCIGK